MNQGPTIPRHARARIDALRTTRRRSSRGCKLPQPWAHGRGTIVVINLHINSLRTPSRVSRRIPFSTTERYPRAYVERRDSIRKAIVKEEAIAQSDVINGKK